MGECSAYSGSLQGNLKVKFADCPTNWRPPGADRLSLEGPKVNSGIWLHAVDDNTINVVPCIVILLLLFYFFALCSKDPEG